MDRVGRVFAGSVIFLLALTLTACAGPMDEKLVTGSTQEVYSASLAPIVPKMTAHEREAFNWAVSDFDLAKLHSKYPNASPKAIIRGEVEEVLGTYPKQIEELEARQAEFAPVQAELRKIAASNTRFSINRNFFGLQPRITANVFNGSTLPISRLDWRASLYLDGASKPVATTTLVNDYRNDGGLKPSQRFNVTFNVGYLRGDERWLTLEIRNARERRVVLEPILDSVQDFGERAYLAEDPAQRIERRTAAIKAAQSFSDI